MKLPTAPILALVVCLLVFSSVEGVVEVDSAFCATKCKARCAKASAKDRCLFYCGVCCRDCSCVPSGTYGNKDECPCYRDKLTSDQKRKPKCP
ncbi:unnamed protein product [Spirodela intermedia]|uniref:Uncharacterized protein n=2 Tax=Spirodela intermedia TaxID=51605 RepID=A0A7I8K796_SPIIN|nr:unnamed protein product [Spirodela intermedia]CAA6657484.1 unnamed protein product [Spirodela intermedia]CAA7393550.1 unnamed protein product [Spirodela intermedia]